MTNKAFSILLLFTLVFGGALGAAFAAGVALGKSRGPDPSQESSSFRPPRSSQGGESRPGGSRAGGFPGSSRGGESLPGADARGREGGFSRRSGEASAAPDGGPGSGGGVPQDAAGRQGIIGTVDRVQDNLVTLNTFQGPVQVRLEKETAIQNTAQATVADLVEGARIRIIGRRDQEGNLQARAVTLLLPDSAEGTGEESRRDESSIPGGDFVRRTPVTGTIVSVEDGLVIVSGPEGQLKVTLRAGARIQKTTAGTQADLVEGARVRVIGEIGEAGDIVARSLTVVPADGDGFFGRRGDRGRQ